MELLELTFEEARVLGCLMEKKETTPEYYPLSLNALTNACNQSTNRNPVVSFDEGIVEKALNSLRDKHIVIPCMGGRVKKYRYEFPATIPLDEKELALICVLLLRGAQTIGELRTRTERLYFFGAIEEVDDCLTKLAERSEPLVVKLPQQRGQKERRYAQLLHQTNLEELQGEGSSEVNDPVPISTGSDITALKQELELLKQELGSLKQRVSRLEA